MKKIFLILGIVYSLATKAQSTLQPSDSIQFYKILKELTFRDTLTTLTIRDSSGIMRGEPADISPFTFDSLFKPIIGKVMLGNNDLVNQGSAYALAVDQFSSQFNINYNWAANKKKSNKLYYNIGFVAASSSKVVPIFTKNEWQKGLSLSFGFNRALNKNAHYSRPTGYGTNRKRFLALALKETYSSLLEDSVVYINNRLIYDSTKLDNWINPSQFMDSMRRISYKNNKEFEQAESSYKKALNIRKLNDSGIVKYVDSIFYALEIKTFPKIDYYSLQWITASIRPEYKGIAIYDTSAARIAGIKGKNYVGINLDLVYNSAYSTTKSLFIWQAGLSFKNTNYLEGRKPEDIDFLQADLNNNITITDKDEALIVDNYEKYKKQFLLITPSIGFNWFWGTKRHFGIEAFISSKIGLKSSKIPYDNLFSFRCGPLFSINGKDDLAKSTFGLIVKWEDVKYKNAQLKDGFSFSIRIGVPFNL